jgi:hypothetical protein
LYYTKSTTTNVVSTLNSRIADSIQAHDVKSLPPPIPYTKPAKSQAKKKQTDFHDFEILLDLDDEISQKTKKTSPTSDDGDPEMWCERRFQFQDSYL